MEQFSDPSGYKPAGNPDKGKNSEPAHIHWHPAFVEAIQLELKAFRDVLEFHFEYPLTSEPLKIDCVIIKKTKDAVIEKNIAAIFREVNLLEYKCPDAIVSTADFYKVYGYACLYASFVKVPVTSISLSFIESRYPVKLVRHLKNVRGYTVEETAPGIYTVRGDILAIQIINSRRLSSEENLWLRGLNNRLKPVEYLLVNNEVYRQGKDARIQAYMNVVARANFHAVEEALKMGNAAKSLDEVLVRTGLVARVEARAKENAALAIAQNMVNLGLPQETIVSATGLAPEKVKELYQG